MAYSKALNEIFYNLDRGFIYATWQQDLRFPGYWAVLRKEIGHNFKPIIEWNHYGSSAERFTKGEKQRRRTVEKYQCLNSCLYWLCNVQEFNRDYFKAV